VLSVLVLLGFNRIGVEAERKDPQASETERAVRYLGL
jgi:hypothetical protein